MLIPSWRRDRAAASVVKNLLLVHRMLLPHDETFCFLSKLCSFVLGQDPNEDFIVASSFRIFVSVAVAVAATVAERMYNEVLKIVMLELFSSHMLDDQVPRALAFAVRYHRLN